MRHSKPLLLIVLLICLVVLAGCSAYSEKDVVDRWTNTKSPHIRQVAGFPGHLPG